MMTASTTAPLTAASIVDAKLDAIQLRLAHLWQAAHSPLALQQPLLAAAYLRQLRLLAFHHDIQLATKETQLGFCTRCCQVHIPGVNVTIQIQQSRFAKKRRRRREKAREWKKAHQATPTTTTTNTSTDDAPSGMDDVSATDSESAATTPRKRQRTAPPVTPATPASSLAAATAATTTSNSKAHAVHEIAVRCHACKHIDYAAGVSSKQRELLHQSNPSLEQLLTDVAERNAQPAIEEARELASKKKHLLHSLQGQSQTATVPAAPKPTLASLQQLAEAQQRFQQTKQSLSGGGGGGALNAALLPANAPASTNSFFQDQFRSAVGAHTPVTSATTATTTPSKPFSFTAKGTVATSPASAITPAAATTPFSFSRAGTGAAVTPISTLKLGSGGSLYTMMQQSTMAAPPPAPVHVPSSAPFSFSKSTPVVSSTSSAAKTPSKPTKPAAPATTPSSMMGGIQIAAGMKSLTPSGQKTYTIAVKGGKNAAAGKNNNRR